MPLYYFRLRDRDTIRDDVGTDLADESAARDHAKRVARELTFNSTGMLQHRWSNWSLTVHDADGAELFSLPMSDFDDDAS